MTTKHPFPRIPELASITEVRSLNDVLKLQEFVFSTIPYTNAPFEETEYSFTLTYERFKKKELGGWCGLNAEYFRRLLVCYGVKVEPYNYGIASSRFTHVCLLVTFDNIEFLLDPYFNRIYTYENDFPLQFPDLMRLIREKKLDKIKSRYGAGRKSVWKNQIGRFLLESGSEFEKEVFLFFRSIGLDPELERVFGSKNPLCMLSIKI